MKRLIKFTILTALIYTNSNAANFKFAFCNSINDTNCTGTDTLLKVESTRCNPEIGKCTISAKCNESLDFKKIYKKSLNNTDDAYLSILSFGYSDCTKGETLEITAECTRNACIDNSKIAFLQMEVGHLDTSVDRKYPAPVEIKKLNKSGEFSISIKSTSKEYYAPVMTCSLYKKNHLISRKTYDISRTNNGNLEMLKANKQYTISNGPLSWDLIGGLSINCNIYEYNEKDNESPFFNDER